MKFNVICYKIIKKLNRYIRKKRLFSKKYRFIDRSKGSEDLFIILAGFQEYYWNGITERVKLCEEVYQKEKNQNIDVCVCVPQGMDNLQRLEEICEINNWSYLWIDEDLLAKVQNTAIKLHPNAKWIFKIDEDIILPNDYIANMKNAYLKAEDTMFVEPGLLVPCINVNAYGVIPFLRALGIEQEYSEKFGRYAFGAPYNRAYHGDKIHSEPEVGKWIWQKSVPFDNIAKIISDENRGKIGWCANRFSIGAILLKRDFWELIGGFEVGIEGEMGLEEEQINSFCAAKNCGIFVAEDIFVGHLGFGKQKEVVKEFYLENKKQIDICK